MSSLLCFSLPFRLLACETGLCYMGYCTPRATMPTKGCQTDCQNLMEKSCVYQLFGGCLYLCVCTRVRAMCVHPSSRPRLVTAERNQAPATGTCSLCGFLISLCFRKASLPGHLPDPSSPPLLLLFEVVTRPTQQCPRGSLFSLSQINGTETCACI